MSYIARSAASAIARPRHATLFRQAQQLRSVHIENNVHENMPFDYKKKKTYGTKLALYLVSGFAIPFGAAYYQLAKKSGAS